MDRIATFSHQSQLVQTMMKAESKVAKAQSEASTQLKSTDYAGIASQSSQLVNLESYYARSERYVDEGDIVSSRIDIMSDAVGSMIDVANDLKSLITSLQGTGASAAESIKEQAQAYMDNFVSLLNTQSEGRYLFAGGKTDSAPVSIDSSVYTPATYPSTANTSYYSGDSSKTLFRASDDQVIDYGVTADDSSFEKALRAFSLIANMSTDPVDDDLVNEADTLASEAVDGMTVKQTKLGAAGDALETTIDRHLDEQLVLQSQVEDIKNVDLAAATTRLSQLEALLEASTQVLTVMKSFNLNDLL